MMRCSATCCIIIALLICLPAIAMPVMADGVSYYFVSTSSSEAWSQVDERSQFAIINYADGYEKMIISIQVDEEELETGSEMFWLFPIPSRPQDINLNITSNVPRLDGALLGDVLKEDVADSGFWNLCLWSQVYTWATIPFVLFLTMGLGVGGGLQSEVATFEVAEKYGLSSVVISATNASDLQEYFDLNGLTIPDSDLDIVDDCIASGFSFVATRINNLESFRNNATLMHEGDDSFYIMGVEVDFPSDEIFFPLKLTSVYGDSNIPITVQVIGFTDIAKKPRENSSLRISVDYRKIQGDCIVQGRDHFGNYIGGDDKEQMIEFFKEQKESSRIEAINDPEWYRYTIYNLEFTTIKIDGNASALNEDLWVSDAPPLGIAVTNYFEDNPGIAVILIFIFISMLAGLIAGFFFNKDSGHIPQYLLIGLANLLTVLAVVAVYHRYYEKWKREEKHEGEEVSNDGTRPFVRFNFFIAYTTVFMILLFSAWEIFQI